MAKQHRTASRPARKQTAVKLKKALRPKKAQKSKPVISLPRQPKRRERVPAPPLDRSGHLDAMAVYERGVGALQRRKYAEAASLLRTVIETYPDEKELHDRARLYLNVCQRQAVPPDATPGTFEERVYAATLAINGGAYEEGVVQLQALAEEIPDYDHVQYMLAVVHTLRGDMDRAWPHLQRAVDLNPNNRFLARQDADLEPIRRDPQFRRVLERPPVRRERRGAHRSKTAR